MNFLTRSAVAAALFSFALAAGAAEPHSDVRVLIDVSGSMKQNDPNNLRVPATKLLLKLIPDGTDAGVWTFGEKVSAIIPQHEVTSAWRNSAAGQLGRIGSSELFTNIGLALETASTGWDKPDAEKKRTLILLTDGMLDVSKSPVDNAVARSAVLDNTLVKLAEEGVQIHTIALSDNADAELLKTLSIKTNGDFNVAKNADELLKIFLKVFDKTVPQEQVPLEDNKFNIDTSVEEFTALVFRTKPESVTELITPMGVHVSANKLPGNVSWFHDKNYDLITVTKPQAGKWNIVGDVDPANRVTIVTNLSLAMEGMPNNIIEGEKVNMSMHLEEDGKLLNNKAFLGLLDIEFAQNKSTGENFVGKLSIDKNGNPRVPEDGVYSVVLGKTLTEGDHEFTVLLDGKTFKRKRAHSMHVYKDVLDVQTKNAEKEGETASIILTPKNGLIDPEKTKLSLQVHSPKGEDSEVTAQFDGAKHGWVVELPPTAGEGEYNLTASVHTQGLTGAELDLVQGPMPVSYLPGSVPHAEEKTEEHAAEPAPEEHAEAPAEEHPAEAEHPAEEQPAEEAKHDQPEEKGKVNWILWGGVFVVVNLVLFGAALFLYKRFARKKLVEEVVEAPAVEPPKAAAAEPPAHHDDSDDDAGPMERLSPAAASKVPAQTLEEEHLPPELSLDTDAFGLDADEPKLRMNDDE